MKRLSQFERNFGKNSHCSTANYPITIWRLTNFSVMTMIRSIESLIQHGRWWPGYCNWHQDEQKTCLGWQLKIVKATKKGALWIGNDLCMLHCTGPVSPGSPETGPGCPVTGPACLWASSNATCLLKDTSWLFSQTLVMACTLIDYLIFDLI